MQNKTQSERSSRFQLLIDFLDRNELFFTLHNASLSSWWQTISWLGYNLLGSLVPIWGTFFLLKLHHQMPHLNDFVRHGEFALYTAAFLAPALQLVVRNIRDSRYVLGTASALFGVAGLVIAVVIYSGVVLGAETKEGIDEVFLRHVSLALFFISLVFAVIVTEVENIRIEPNVTGYDAAERTQLNTRFKKKNPVQAEETSKLPDEPDESEPPSEESLREQFSKKDVDPSEGEQNG